MTIFGHFKWMRERVGQVIIALALTYCVPKCVHFAAVILEINFQFLAYM